MRNIVRSLTRLNPTHPVSLYSLARPNAPSRLRICRRTCICNLQSASLPILNCLDLDHATLEPVIQSIQIRSDSDFIRTVNTLPTRPTKYISKPNHNISNFESQLPCYCIGPIDPTSRLPRVPLVDSPRIVQPVIDLSQYPTRNVDVLQLCRPPCCPSAGPHTTTSRAGSQAIRRASSTEDGLPPFNSASTILMLTD